MPDLPKPVAADPDGLAPLGWDREFADERERWAGDDSDDELWSGFPGAPKRTRATGATGATGATRANRATGATGRSEQAAAIDPADHGQEELWEDSAEMLARSLEPVDEPARRTVKITGRGSDRLPAPRPRTARSGGLARHERANFRPDRMAMWAVLLGALLVLVAATSSHAAMLANHLAH